VSRNIFMAKFFYHIGEPVILRIDVGVVDLVGISRKHDFSPLSSSGENSFDLMRG